MLFANDSKPPHDIKVLMSHSASFIQHVYPRTSIPQSTPSPRPSIMPHAVPHPPIEQHTMEYQPREGVCR